MKKPDFPWASSAYRDMPPARASRTPAWAKP